MPDKSNNGVGVAGMGGRGGGGRVIKLIVVRQAMMKENDG